MPNEHVKSIFEITPEYLLEKGIKGIITDLDNTLVPWNVADATPKVKQWFSAMTEHDIKITVMSNNNEDRVKVFSEPLKIPYVYKANKPLGKGFKKAVSLMGIEKKQVVVLGDQLLTDILGGNLAGLYTVLVAPIVETDAKITKFNRKIERRILRSLRKKGMINWEE